MGQTRSVEALNADEGRSRESVFNETDCRRSSNNKIIRAIGAAALIMFSSAFTPQQFEAIKPKKTSICRRDRVVSRAAL